METSSLSSFDFAFDPSLVATEAVEPRSDSRLMVVHRATGKIRHDRFFNLAEYLPSGSLVVVNDTLVLSARFTGQRETGARIEGLFLRPDHDGVWVWLKGHVRSGEDIGIEGFGSVKVRTREDKRAFLEVNPLLFTEFLSQKGLTPLPPYIRSERERRGLDENQEIDKTRYQSIFANSQNQASSVAAPTASLHFDQRVIERIQQKDIRFCSVRLDVGEGTFEPIMTENLEDVVLHSERVSISDASWMEIQKAKKEGRKVIAIGTTVLRALESAALRPNGPLQFETQLFVRPPFDFKIVDALVTNFHWPKSSLLVLVAAFMGDSWRAVYETAVKERYRLFSFGDGMLIV